MFDLLRKIFSFDWLDSDIVRDNLRFFVLLFILGLIYLLNSLLFYNKIIRYKRLEREVKLLRIRYIDMEQRLTNKTLYSDVEKRVKQMHLLLRAPERPPEIILIDEE